LVEMAIERGMEGTNRCGLGSYRSTRIMSTNLKAGALKESSLGHIEGTEASIMVN
jgi:hypothetical protein